MTSSDSSEPVYRYHAYLASGLTGIRGVSRAHLAAVRDAIESACRSRGIRAYRPERKTHPDDFPSISAEEVWAIDRREALRSDLLILHADTPTTGGGMEYEFARSARMPTLVVAAVETEVSKMVLGAPLRKEIVRYATLADVQGKVESGIDKLWPSIVDRNEVVMGDASNNLGRRIRLFREIKGWSQEELANELGTNVDDVSYYEEAADGASNLSVPGLKFLSKVLGVSLFQLVAPEEEVLADFTGIQQPEIGAAVWARARRVPRGPGSARMSHRDRATIEAWLRDHPVADTT